MRRTPTKQDKKLKVNSETVRELSADKIANVAGGGGHLPDDGADRKSHNHNKALARR